MSNQSDFSAIQQDIINYLKNQSKFTAYNFDGSAISVLVDILSYNTSIASANANLAFNESFLDTAVQRANVVSSSKELGYIPRSMIAPLASITISFSVTGNPAQYLMPRGTRFSTSVDGTTYTYVLTDDATFQNISNIFTGTVTIAQGVLTNFKYIIDNELPQQRLSIPSTQVDLTYLGVSWKSQNTDPLYTIIPSADSIGFGNISGTTQVYFVQEMFDGYYDVYFGDGVFGAKNADGNVILLDYLITDGDASNGANTFTLASSLSGISSVSITTVNPASGGSPQETVDSIKFLAPLFFQSQERAVTENDYVALLKNNLGNIDDVSVWGGEKQNPPYYGKVFIAVKPHGEDFLSTSEKNNVVNLFLSKYNIVGVRPSIVDPNYLYVNVSTTVRYDARLFNRNTNIDLESNISAAITAFFDASVNRFGQNLYFSKLVATIDNVSPIIKTNITNLTLERHTEIVPSAANQYNFEFNNAVEPNSLTSNSIVIGGNNYFLKDIPQGTSPYTTGNIAVYNLIGNTINYLFTNVGTINYNTGEVLIQNLTINDITNDPIGKVLIVTVAQGEVADQNAPTNIVNDSNVYANGLDDVVVLGTLTINLVAS